MKNCDCQCHEDGKRPRAKDCCVYVHMDLYKDLIDKIEAVAKAHLNCDDGCTATDEIHDLIQSSRQRDTQDER